MTGRRATAALLALLVVATGPVGACSSESAGRDREPGTGPASTVALDHETADWSQPGGDFDNSRAVLDSPISRATVDRLATAWSTPLPGASAFGNAATTPLIVDGTVYVQDLSSNVRAVDLRTGAVRWEREYGNFQIGPNGVALEDGRLFVAKGPHAISALDAATGDELWETRLIDSGTMGIDIQPQVFDGLVLVATVPISILGQYVGGDAGVLYALDAETGDEVWHFDTVEGDDVWGAPEVNAGGGAWYPPAIDTEAGVVYWGIANPAPFPGTDAFPNGTSRPGPNLYTNSVVALDVHTGELQWYHQAIEHDLFDRDLVHTAIAHTDDGEVIIGTGKLGRVLGHDPATGELRFDTPIGRHQNDDLTELDGPTEVYPGTYGGVLTPPAVADGIVYAATLNLPSVHEPDVNEIIGSDLGVEPGAVVAVDAADGRVLWSTEVDGDPMGAALVLSDLVFTATFQGELFALDRGTGEIVWQMTAPGGVNGWPASVGDTIVWPVGMADPPTLLALRLQR